jgi:GT2 family glycosyltransferase
MITIIYSTHKSEDYNENFKEHITKSVGIKDVQILEYVNHNEYSLSQVYNRGISESIYDIVVCCHNDIKLENGWGKKLLKDFEDNPEYGIIGKAGSCYFSESGVYWDRMLQTMVGQVYHHPEGQKKWLSRYSPKLPFLIPVVTIDGLFISFNKTRIKHTFDETVGKFHFYDHLFCIPNFIDSVKIGVTSSFEITHQSIGQPNQEFWESKKKFVEKWGWNLPIDLKPEKIYVPEIKERPLKNIGKVAVIIPTKGKLELLLPCLDSFYEHCNNNLFDVFIADTGSSDEEKNQIKNYISLKGNIKLIEYDYYNFAKINNDVVKNHINDSYEFLLFCNNDIKLLNNVIYGMLKVFKENPRTGTVGARLHFEDGTVQHDGVNLYRNRIDNNFGVTHLSLNNYYNYTTIKKDVIGSTGALLMIRKILFKKIECFNENYTECFEDVELNLKSIILGYNNVCDGSLVAYHYESQTRNEDNNKLNRLQNDWITQLLPLVKNNIDKLSPKMYMIN